MQCSPFTRAALSGLTRSTTTGFVAGSGLEFTASFLQFSREFRYTRWRNTPFTGPSGNANQIDILLRIALPVTGHY